MPGLLQAPTPIDPLKARTMDDLARVAENARVEAERQRDLAPQNAALQATQDAIPVRSRRAPSGHLLMDARLQPVLLVK